MAKIKMMTGPELQKMVADSIARRNMKLYKTPDMGVGETPASDNFTPPAVIPSGVNNQTFGAGLTIPTPDVSKYGHAPTEMAPVQASTQPIPRVPDYGAPAPGQMMQSNATPPPVVMRGGTTGTDAMSRLRALAQTRASLQLTKGI
jgi:hypothetical protein